MSMTSIHIPPDISPGISSSPSLFLSFHSSQKTSPKKPPPKNLPGKIEKSDLTIAIETLQRLDKIKRTEEAFIGLKASAANHDHLKTRISEKQIQIEKLQFELRRLQEEEVIT
jgi:hypothetical protein